MSNTPSDIQARESGVPYLSVVVPVYNEEGNLRPLVAEIMSAMSRAGREYEILLIDDGSRDASLAEIRELAAAHPEVGYLAFASNCGQSAAFAAGFEAARGEIVVTMDADLQNDPADVPAMLALYESDGLDMVIGWRARRMDTWIKRISSKVGNGVRNWLTKETVHDTGCSLKLLRASMARRIPMFTGMHRFLPTLMKMQGARVGEVKVNHRPRAAGVSKYGTLDRALAGAYDLFAVRWMQRRAFRYQVRERG